MPERLTDRLVELGELDPERAEAALDRQVLQGGALDTSLFELGLCDEATVLNALAEAYDAPTAEAEVACADPDPRALRAFPEPWAKKHMLAPLRLSADGGTLEILSPGPADGAVLARLSDLLELSLSPVLAPEFRVWQRLSRLYEIDPPERFRALIAAQETGDVLPASAPPAKPADDDAPLGFSEAVNLLREAKDRDEIVRIALRYARRDLELVAMFINHDHQLEGWMGAGPGAEHLPQVHLDLTKDSAFRVVLDTQAHYLGPVPSDPAHGELLERLGRARPRGVLIVPVRIRNRTVAVIYGENGPEPIPPRLAADLMLFTTHVQMALEGLLMRRKAESLSELRRLDSQTPRPTPEVQAVEAAPRFDTDPTDLSGDLDTEGLDGDGDITDSTPAPLGAVELEDVEARDDEVAAATDPTDPAMLDAVVAPEPEPEPTIDEDAPEVPPAEAAEAPVTEPEPVAPDEDPPSDRPTDEDLATVEDEPPASEEPVGDEPLDEPPSLADVEDEPLDVDEDDDTEPPADPTLPLLARSDSWARATLLPEEPEEMEDGHPLLDAVDDGWTSVDAPDLGAELDASITAAQDALQKQNPSGVFDRNALASTHDGQQLLEELDELTSSLEEALAQSESARPADPTAPELEAPDVPSLVPVDAPPEDGSWEDVDVDEWSSPTPAEPEPEAPAAVEPASTEEETDRMRAPLADTRRTAEARASLTEDATLPDLSAEAWIRASSEIVRPRSLPAEVMEAAARPEEPDPVPLTRITIGRRELSNSSPDLQEVHRNPTSDDRYEAPHPSLAEDPAGTVPILLGRPPGGTDEEVPIPLTSADRLDEEPVPLTQLSTGGYSADAPVVDQIPQGPQTLEAELASGIPSPLRAVPAPTQPVSEAQIRAARFEQEALQWRAQLEHGESAQQTAAAEALVGMGPEALPYVGDRFPGPLNLDPFLPEAELPPFTKCGALLSVLERFGRDAHPYVVRHLDAPSPHHRFFAIYFYGAVYVPEAIPRLIQRLHDEEPRICMLAARTLFSYREHPDFAIVLDHLHGRLAASSAVARRHACYLLGLFRDVTAIPKLIEIIDRKEKGMVDVAEDALAEITKQRLGGSSKKWNAWWAKNRDRSRLSWLVDGLAAKDADLRRSAAEELRAVTGLDMGFDENAPKRQREEARQRWIVWWREQERLVSSS